MTIPEIRSAVVYSRNETVNGKVKRVSHDAIVTGYERAASHDPATDGPPMINLAFAEPGQEACFAGVNWASGFSRAFSVPHESVDSSGHHFYSFADAEPALPSAADLDKVAEEEATKAATEAKPNGKKSPKPVAVGK